mmetsp:Transcript_6106/g.26923  ORF Transcript_6106/g.26923 Transcript_6106/m.26923 type:complete len:232 (+) Transcript_6106:756-1451(+)
MLPELPLGALHPREQRLAVHPRPAVLLDVRGARLHPSLAASQGSLASLGRYPALGDGARRHRGVRVVVHGGVVHAAESGGSQHQREHPVAPDSTRDSASGSRGVRVVEEARGSEREVGLRVAVRVDFERVGREQTGRRGEKRASVAVGDVALLAFRGFRPRQPTPSHGVGVPGNRGGGFVRAGGRAASAPAAFCTSVGATKRHRRRHRRPGHRHERGYHAERCPVGVFSID